MKLTQAQRQALMQFLESIIITALVAGLTAALPLVSGDGPIDWHTVMLVGGTGILLSLAHSGAAYLRQSAPNSVAPTDLVSLADLIDALADGLAKRYSTRPMTMPQPDMSNIPAHLQSLSSLQPAPVQDISAQETLQHPAIPSQQ